MRAKRPTTERDNGNALAERRAIKLMRIGVGTPEDERRWARAAALPVAELRRRAESD
jgi:hypothetical protein